jgi:hypothetical protein
VRTAPMEGRHAVEKQSGRDIALPSTPAPAPQGRKRPLFELFAALATQNLRDIAETSYPANVEPAATECATPNQNPKET